MGDLELEIQITPFINLPNDQMASWDKRQIFRQGNGDWHFKQGASAIGINGQSAIAGEEYRDLRLRAYSNRAGHSGKVGEECMRVLWKCRIGQKRQIIAEQCCAIGQITRAN